MSTVTSFYLHVVGRKFHTEIFVSPLSERCWHILGMSHDHPCLYEDRPQLLLTSEDWIHATISTGLAAIPSSGIVACVQRGAWRKPWYTNMSSVTWCFVWTEVVSKITTQKRTYETSFHSFSMETAGALTKMYVKEHGYLQLFLKRMFSIMQ